MPSPTTIFDRWTVVIVPFPFVDSLGAKPRPALVLSPRDFNRVNGHTIYAMITRGLGVTWPSDVSIERYREAGLPAPSVVRWKLFTLDNRIIERSLGLLTQDDRQDCAAALRQIMIEPKAPRRV
jgi:mRNA interferase MazF